MIACRNILFVLLLLSDPGQYAGFVTVGDFNHDSKLDTAMLHGTPILTYSRQQFSERYFGDGNGGFAAPTAYYPVDRGAVHMVTRDFNGDHHLDLAVAKVTAVQTICTLAMSACCWGTAMGTFNAGSEL